LFHFFFFGFSILAHRIKLKCLHSQTPVNRLSTKNRTKWRPLKSGFDYKEVPYVS